MFFCVEEFDAVGDQGVRKAANSTLELVHSILLRASDGFVALQESFWYLNNLHNECTGNGTQHVRTTVGNTRLHPRFFGLYPLVLSSSMFLFEEGKKTCH